MIDLAVVGIVLGKSGSLWWRWPIWWWITLVDIRNERVNPSVTLLIYAIHQKNESSRRVLWSCHISDRKILPQYSGSLLPRCSPGLGVDYPHPLVSMECCGLVVTRPNHKTEKISQKSFFFFAMNETFIPQCLLVKSHIKFRRCFTYKISCVSFFLWKVRTLWEFCLFVEKRRQRCKNNQNMKLEKDMTRSYIMM